MPNTRASGNVTIAVGGILFVVLTLVYAWGVHDHIEMSPLLQWGGAIVAALLVGGQMSSALSGKLAPVKEQLQMIQKQTNGELSNAITEQIKTSLSSAEFREIVRSEVSAALTHQDAAKAQERIRVRKTATPRKDV